jgi:hypothetical protein
MKQIIITPIKEFENAEYFDNVSCFLLKNLNEYLKSTFPVLHTKKLSVTMG